MLYSNFIEIASPLIQLSCYRSPYRFIESPVLGIEQQGTDAIDYAETCREGGDQKIHLS